MTPTALALMAATYKARKRSHKAYCEFHKLFVRETAKQLRKELRAKRRSLGFAQQKQTELVFA